MAKIFFKIHGLDCAQEVSVLKRALSPLVLDESAIEFDLFNARMSVDTGSSQLGAGEIILAVNHTGMRAVRWEEHATAAPETPWHRYAREIACALSALAAAAGFAAHGAAHGWLHALADSDTEGGGYPPLAIALLAFSSVAGLWFVFPRAWHALRTLRPDMNLLMSVAVGGAWILGSWSEAAMVAALFATSLLLETWSVGRARRAIESLMDLRPAMARVVSYGEAEHGREGERPREPESACHAPAREDARPPAMSPVAEVPLDALVAVHPGERIPLDGVVTEGHTSVNQAPITGESTPVAKEPSCEVFAGSINNEGAFTFRVTRAANDTQLARIIHMVEEAQGRRAPSEQWVDAFARYYTPAMMALAVCAVVFPPLVWGTAWSAAFYQALVLLLIACPCALVISTPVSIVAGLASAARAGVLIKGGVYLEAPARLRAVALDKTGTLTHGTPEVRTLVPLAIAEEELLARAASIESKSQHPIARAIVRCANEREIALRPVERFRAIAGMGAEARLDGVPYRVGSLRFLRDAGVATPELESHAAALAEAGHTIIAIADDARPLGLIGVSDTVRAESRDAIAALRKAGIEYIAVLTGDNRAAAQAVALACGIDDCRAELLPEDKLRAIEALRAQHGSVAMIGDGVNDAPAMAAATLGIAMGAAGSDAALETADIALMSDRLDKLPWLIAHSRRTLNVIRQNVALALGIKAAVLLLALLGHASLWAAIMADMGASLLVVFNGLRLLRARSDFLKQ